MRLSWCGRRNLNHQERGVVVCVRTKVLTHTETQMFKDCFRLGERFESGEIRMTKKWEKALFAVSVVTLIVIIAGYNVAQFYPVNTGQTAGNFEPIIQISPVTDIRVVEGSQYQYKWESKLTIIIIALAAHACTVSLNGTRFIEDEDLQGKLLSTAPENPSVTILKAVPEYLPQDRTIRTLEFPVVVIAWLSPSYTYGQREIKIGDLEFVLVVFDTVTKTTQELRGEAHVIWIGR